MSVKLPVKISSKMMRLRFRPCEENYIKNYCKGACCRGSNGKTLVSIHNSEVNRFCGMGDNVVFGRLNPSLSRCKYQNENNLCSIHFKEQPFGCIASPFTLNKNNTLIVRHRYLMFKCHNKGKKAVPAYKAHFKSLVLLFGKEEAIKIRLKLITSRKDFVVGMDSNVFSMLKDNDEIKKSQLKLV